MASKTAPKMEYTRLGNSGLKISKVIFGTMSLGSSEWYVFLSPLLVDSTTFSVEIFLEQIH
jgi:aryl-alcohol dehydrogenase-like predicted oxidoreductase